MVLAAQQSLRGFDIEAKVPACTTLLNVYSLGLGAKATAKATKPTMTPYTEKSTKMFGLLVTEIQPKVQAITFMSRPTLCHRHQMQAQAVRQEPLSPARRATLS
jgi:hypothetical protein